MNHAGLLGVDQAQGFFTNFDHLPPSHENYAQQNETATNNSGPWLDAAGRCGYTELTKDVYAYGVLYRPYCLRLRAKICRYTHRHRSKFHQDSITISLHGDNKTLTPPGAGRRFRAIYVFIQKSVLASFTAAACFSANATAATSLYFAGAGVADWHRHICVLCVGSGLKFALL